VLQSNKILCLFSAGLKSKVFRSDKTSNARTMTAVTILANVQYTVFTFANLDIATSSLGARRMTAARRKFHTHIA
jgi:hypothetical protein